MFDSNLKYTYVFMQIHIIKLISPLKTSDFMINMMNNSRYIEDKVIN